MSASLSETQKIAVAILDLLKSKQASPCAPSEVIEKLASKHDPWQVREVIWELTANAAAELTWDRKLKLGPYSELSLSVIEFSTPPRFQWLRKPCDGCGFPLRGASDEDAECANTNCPGRRIKHGIAPPTEATETNPRQGVPRQLEHWTCPSCGWQRYSNGFEGYCPNEHCERYMRG